MDDGMKTMVLRDHWVEAEADGKKGEQDDTFTICCPSCSIRYRIPKKKADRPRKVRCIHCSAKFIIAISNPC